jgi:hypothetical protein
VLTGRNGVSHHNVSEQVDSDERSDKRLEKLGERRGGDCRHEVGEVECNDRNNVGQQQQDGVAGGAYAPNASAKDQRAEQRDLGSVETVGQQLPLGLVLVFHVKVCKVWGGAVSRTGARQGRRKFGGNEGQHAP